MAIEGNVTAVLIVLVALLLGGLVSLLLGAAGACQLGRLMWRGRLAEGTVTRLIDVGSGGPESALQGEVEFRDPDAGVVRILSRGRRYPAGFVVGQRVRVAYVAGEPREARIVEELRATAGWLGVIGATLVLLAGVTLLNVWPSSH